MASPFAPPLVLAAMRAALVADVTLTAALAVIPSELGTGPAIYAENAVPQRATMPYLTIGAATEVPFNTMGGEGSYGSQCTVQVKGFSRRTADEQVLSLMGYVKARLDDAELAVAGYGTAFCEFDTAVPIFTEDVAGVLIRQLPMIFRVHVHQS